MIQIIINLNKITKLQVFITFIDDYYVSTKDFVSQITCMSRHMDHVELTKDNLSNITILNILVHQQPLIFAKATSFQLHKVPVLHSRNKNHLVKEVVHVLLSLHKELFHGHLVSIW